MLPQNPDDALTVRGPSNDGHGAAQAGPERLIELVRVLEPYSDADRIRLIAAAFAFLGTRLPSGMGNAEKRDGAPNQIVARAEDVSRNGATDAPLARRAQTWMAQHAIKTEELDGIFHRSASGVEMIAHKLPGRTIKDLVHQCYLLSGVRALLSNGEPRFGDEEARAMCRDLGAYDRANHATYLRAIGNEMSGSKWTGYELTQPGLRAAGDLIRSMQNVISY